MNIQILGKLEPDGEIPEWLVSAPVPVPYFDGLSLPVVLQNIEDDSSPADFEKALSSFLSLGPTERKHAADYVFHLYRQYTCTLNEDGLDINIPSASVVWDYVRPTELHVCRRRAEHQSVYVVIRAECQWDIEHGLVVVYREGSVLSRVSEFDGHLTSSDAFGVPEDKDTIIYEG